MTTERKNTQQEVSKALGVDKAKIDAANKGSKIEAQRSHTAAERNAPANWKASRGDVEDSMSIADIRVSSISGGPTPSPAAGHLPASVEHGFPRPASNVPQNVSTSTLLKSAMPNSLSG
jgi:hypothetical protein